MPVNCRFRQAHEIVLPTVTTSPSGIVSMICALSSLKPSGPMSLMKQPAGAEGRIKLSRRQEPSRLE